MTKLSSVNGLKLSTCLPALLLASSIALAAPQQNPLANVRIVIVRHAEKPEEGRELTSAGVARANAYAGYFSHLNLDGKPFHFDHLFAAKDSKKSIRPRLTLTPYSEAVHKPLDLRFSDKDPDAIAKDLQTNNYGHDILICWRHTEIPNLLTALGANSTDFVPDNHWPNNVYDWVIELTFDSSGKLIPQSSHRYGEHLMPGDAH